jgi:hypothetical protein
MEQGENKSIANMTFHAGSMPHDFRLDFDPYLFNSIGYRQHQDQDHWQEFHALDTTNKTVLGSLYLHVENKKAISPLRAPFGGLEASTGLSLKARLTFMQYVEQALSVMSVQTINIKCPPELFDEQPSITYRECGFQITVNEPDACLMIDNTPLSEKMSKDKRARLRQCEAQRLQFRLIPLNQLSEVYRFIAKSRANQGRNLSMSFPDLLKTVNALPQHYFICGVFDQARMIGACICVWVRTDIVYTFYSAHDPEYDTISPRVFLLNHLYDWCANNQVRMLDLGTSALHGEINISLLDFKLRMGAVQTPKYTFSKQL